MSIKGDKQENSMKYFSYGSNMDPDRMKRKGVAFRERRHAVLKGYRLDFNKVSSRNPEEGFGNLVLDHGGFVEGVLYDILEEDILKLDPYEGYPEHYDRKYFAVSVEPEGFLDAIAYVAKPDQTRENLKPRKDYVERLIKGSDLLSPAYVDTLKKTRTL